MTKRKYVKQTFSLDTNVSENLRTAAWYYRTPQSQIVEKALEEYFKRLKLPAVKSRPKKNPTT